MAFGTFTIWLALSALVASMGLYLFGPERSARWGRAAFVLAALAVVGAAAALGVLLVTHRFDVAYVYLHSARGMAPLYWFPSFWAGQEGSFLLWAFWTALLGVVLAATSGRMERRVMPVYGSVLLFLLVMLVIRSPFLPLDTRGMPAPSEGLGLNPNLENPWMVIHPPTLFLGFSALAAPFALALAALLWPAGDEWLRRALPWGLFGFAVLGLAMMMGGYWAYEMLGWGGFWGWDPVENGPLVPWLCLVGFLHIAPIQRARGSCRKTTLLFALLPFLLALYETFLTRTGVLDKFSVHSFSTLGGAANHVLLAVLLLAVCVALGLLAWRGRRIPSGESPWQETASRDFAHAGAVVLLVLCALICVLGMSAPLLTGLAVQLHLARHTGSVDPDFFNRATYPLALLLAAGMGVGPYLAWRGRGLPDSRSLLVCYVLAVLAAVAFLACVRLLGTTLTPARLVPQLLLFTAAVFALVSSLSQLRRLRPQAARPDGPAAPAGTFQTRFGTVGGFLSHAGIALLLLGIVCLVTFTRKDPDVLLVQGRPASVLNGRYTLTYRGQSSDWKNDKNNQLLFDVVSADRKEKFVARLPFALRPLDGAEKRIFAHPAIVAHPGGDLYLALKDGPDQFYKTPVLQPQIKLGQTRRIGPYTIQFVTFERDSRAAAFVQATGQMPDVFPVSAVLRVTYQGQTRLVRPRFITYRDNPAMPESPEVPLPGGWLIAFQSMNAGSADRANPNAGALAEAGSFALRADSGPPREAFQLEVSTRPMIGLIWLGTLVVFAGGLVSLGRRVRENRAVREDLPEAPAAPAAPPRAKGRKTAPARPVPSLSAGQAPRTEGRQGT